jgi:hypothetical protein
MIATLPFAPGRTVSHAELQEDFLKILPDVQRHAHCYFRHLGAEAREEAVAQATALAFATFRRLRERGKDPLAFSGKLARLTARQVQAGRSLGNHQSSTDILSRATQRRWGFRVQSLARQRAADGERWQEAVVDNTQTPPADAAAFRMDFRQWLASLSPRNRQLVDLLVLSHTPTYVARQLKLSRGRISQLRKFFARRWYASQGEPCPRGAGAGACLRCRGVSAWVGHKTCESPPTGKLCFLGKAHGCSWSESLFHTYRDSRFHQRKLEAVDSSRNPPLMKEKEHDSTDRIRGRRRGRRRRHARGAASQKGCPEGV